MSNKEKFLIFLMLFFLVLLVISENSQRRINWYPTYSKNHKIPFGTYIFHKEAKNIFGNSLKDVSSSPYVFLTKNKEAQGNYIFYNTDVSFGETSLKKVLDWVEKGNNIFVFSSSFDKKLLDTLSLKSKYFFNTDLKNKTILKLSNRLFNFKDTIKYDLHKTGLEYFARDTTKKRKIIAGLGRFIIEKDNNHKKNYTDSLFNFIKIRHGKGNVFLHSFPPVVTNYFILKDNNYKYTEALLSYMNNGKNIYWDNQYQNGSKSGGVFSVLKSSPSFLWAYRLLFFGFLFYLLFEGKRKQRPIPIVSPPKNETISFTKTIAEMYLENKEHKEMATLRTRLFFDWIRNNLHLNINKIDDDLFEKIAEKTKTNINDVKKVFEMIDYLDKVQEVRAKDVLKLEKLINIIVKYRQNGLSKQN